jgi:hypothetical protein
MVISGELDLSIGAFVGVALSGGFVWWEVGRYATPQVPVTLFDERRELFAFTAGLFVGIPLAVAYILYITSMASFALFAGLLFLALLVAGTEVAQWALLRTRFWGSDESGPFYALGYRAAIGGIIALALVSEAIAVYGLVPVVIGFAVLDAVAVVALEVAGALLSVRARPGSGRTGGGPVSGAIFAAVGFFLLGVGAGAGGYVEPLAALVAILGGVIVYRRLRSLLAVIPPPSRGPKSPEPALRSSYSRTDRNRPAANAPPRRDS